MPATQVNLAQQVAKNTALMMFGQIAALMANLGVTVLLARYLGESSFGLFSYALVFVSFFAILADFGMKPILVREMAQHPEQTAIILGNVLIIKLVLGLIAVILVVSAAFVLKIPAELQLVIVLLAANILFSSKSYTFRIVFESLFHVRQQMEKPILWQTLDAITLILVIAAMVLSQASLPALAAAYVLSNLPGFVLTIRGAYKIVKPKIVWVQKLNHMLLRESFPLFLYAMVMTLYDRLDVILLEAMKAQEDVGLYAAAFRLVSPLNFVPMAVVTTLYPLMSKYGVTSSEKLNRTFSSGMKILFVIIVPLAVGATFFSDTIFSLLYTAAYQQAAPVFGILMWAEVFVFLNFFIADFNNSGGRQTLNLKAATFMCAANLGLNLLMIPRWNITGASMAKLTTSILGFGFLFWFSYRQTSAAFRSIGVRLLLVLIIFSLWVMVAKTFNFFLVSAISIWFYLFLLFRFNIFDADERRLLASWLGRFNFIRA